MTVNEVRSITATLLSFSPANSLFTSFATTMPFAPLLAWKRGDLLGAAQRLTAAGIAALIAIAVLWAWTSGGRVRSEKDAVLWAKEAEDRGAGEILLTSMDRDGTRQGFDLPLTQAIADSVPVPVIASGGVGNLDHLVDGIRQGHATAVLAASIFHFGEFTIRQAKEHMVRAGLPMRLDP